MTEEKIYEAIRDMANADVIRAWNECADEKGYPENHIYENGPEFIDTMFNSPSDALRAVEYGHYKSNDYYVTFDGYGNLQSFNYWENSYSVDEEILANWLFENQEKLEEFGIADKDEGDEEEDEED